MPVSCKKELTLIKKTESDFSFPVLRIDKLEKFMEGEVSTTLRKPESTDSQNVPETIEERFIGVQKSYYSSLDASGNLKIPTTTKIA